MGEILSVAFSMKYGNCTYRGEEDKTTINPDHDFTANPVDAEIQKLCEVLWTDERKSAWKERQKYSSMTPEERKQAGYT
tara:strand:- start:1499 stop:1735 length:237 start_codon:yes stop_codon:yes gene_type:complete